MFSGVVVQLRSLIFVYIGDGQWHFFNLERLEAVALELAAWELSTRVEGQEVESQDKTRREKEIDWPLYIIK
jgi:hypothetical protein